VLAAGRFVRASVRPLVRDVANAAVCAAGAFWWISRAFA
jgi:hypothetical protein